MIRGALLAAVLVIAAATAQASQQGLVAMQNWKLADKCAKQAQEKFPDFTTEANAKRDAALKQCLEQNNLPPRQ